MNSFRRYVARKILRLLQIEEILNEERLEACRTLVNMGESSSFYPTTRILNLANIPKKITIGQRTHIRGELVVFPSGGEIQIGSDCFIGENSRVWSQNSIVIEDHVMIAHGVNIHDTNSHPIDHIDRRHDYRAIIQSGFPKVNKNIVAKPILVGKDAWIGFNSIVSKGVVIGQGAIVAPGSVILDDVEEFTLVGGNPAMFIRKLDAKTSTL